MKSDDFSDRYVGFPDIIIIIKRLRLEEFPEIIIKISITKEVVGASGSQWLASDARRSTPFHPALKISPSSLQALQRLHCQENQVNHPLKIYLQLYIRESKQALKQSLHFLQAWPSIMFVPPPQICPQKHLQKSPSKAPSKSTFKSTLSNLPPKIHSSIEASQTENTISSFTSKKSPPKALIKQSISLKIPSLISKKKLYFDKNTVPDCHSVGSLKLCGTRPKW